METLKPTFMEDRSDILDSNLQEHQPGFLSVIIMTRSSNKIVKRYTYTSTFSPQLLQPHRPRSLHSNHIKEISSPATITPNATEFLAINLILQTIYLYLHKKYINSNALAKAASQMDMFQLQVPVSLLSHSLEILCFKF